MAAHARVAELVDAHDSKSCSARSGGSIPSTGTKQSSKYVAPHKRNDMRDNVWKQCKKDCARTSLRPSGLRPLADIPIIMRWVVLQQRYIWRVYRRLALF